jgi:hypothetical protein
MSRTRRNAPIIAFTIAAASLGSLLVTSVVPASVNAYVWAPLSAPIIGQHEIYPITGNILTFLVLFLGATLIISRVVGKGSEAKNEK